MWSTLSRAASTQLRLTLQLGTSSVRLRLPALLAPTSSASSASSFTPALATAPAALGGGSAGVGEGVGAGWGLGALWDGILLAVPKSKVSHSRKSMRAANKGLKDRVDLVHCSACGKPKLQHHICAHCYYELNRARKVSLKANSGAVEKNVAHGKSLDSQ